MAGLQHPLFPAFYGMWQEEGSGFLLMEYVRGENMAQMLRRRGRFSLRQTVRAGMELAEGLSYLHEGPGGLLFRDVKPANVVIQQDGRVRLLDLGCACALGERAASRAGTPGFAAPEQLCGEEILTAACDIYGWGRTMEAMLGEGCRSECGGRAERRSGRNVNTERQSEWSESAERRDEWEGNTDQRNEWSGGKAWRGRSADQRSGNQDRKISRQLRQLLAACTEREPSLRVPDMRGVMEALAPLGRESGGRGGRGEDLLSGRGIFCQKNIIAIGKNA